MHWLMSGGRKINDRQAAMNERDASLDIDPHTVIVRSAMRQTGVHRVRDALQLI
jgi:hypothetical protein